MNIQEIFNQSLLLTSKYKDVNLYINRELSWIEFNKRVLHQACRKDIPLIERLNFLGITSSNLDEFIMVRFSSILNKIKREITEPEISGLLPEEEFEKVLEAIMTFKILQEEVYNKLKKKLSKENINICRFNELAKAEREYVEKIFDKNIFPLVTPITYDTTKEFPTLKSKQLNMIVTLEDTNNVNLEVISIITLGGLERVYKIETKDTDEEKYILLEEIIKAFLHKIFINKKIQYCGTLRILREADIELSHNQDVYLSLIHI